MPPSDYLLGKAIGKGSFGSVYLARHRREGRRYVIKKVNLSAASKEERESAKREAMMLGRLQHPNIVAYKESFMDRAGSLNIVMDFCEGGDLYGRIQEQSKKRAFFPEATVIDWLVQLCLALQYIHRAKILHRDLKTQNVFLTKNGAVRVGDFGIARCLEGTMDMAKTLIGTPYYMSPELCENKPYDYKSDVWAVGCVVYEMCTLKHAFEAKDLSGLVFKILKGEYPPLPSKYSSDLAELVRKCLAKEPSDRPTVDDILKMPFVRQRMSSFVRENSGSDDESAGGPAGWRPRAESGGGLGNFRGNAMNNNNNVNSNNNNNNNRYGNVAPRRIPPAQRLAILREREKKAAELREAAIAKRKAEAAARIAARHNDNNINNNNNNNNDNKKKMVNVRARELERRQAMRDDRERRREAAEAARKEREAEAREKRKERLSKEKAERQKREERARAAAAAKKNAANDRRGPGPREGGGRNDGVNDMNGSGGIKVRRRRDRLYHNEDNDDLIAKMEAEVAEDRKRLEQEAEERAKDRQRVAEERKRLGLGNGGGSANSKRAVLEEKERRKREEQRRYEEQLAAHRKQYFGERIAAEEAMRREHEGQGAKQILGNYSGRAGRSSYDHDDSQLDSNNGYDDVRGDDSDGGDDDGPSIDDELVARYRRKAEEETLRMKELRRELDEIEDEISDAKRYDNIVNVVKSVIHEEENADLINTDALYSNDNVGDDGDDDDSYGIRKDISAAGANATAQGAAGLSPQGGRGTQDDADHDDEDSEGYVEYEYEYEYEEVDVMGDPYDDYDLDDYHRGDSSDDGNNDGAGDRQHRSRPYPQASAPRSGGLHGRIENLRVTLTNELGDELFNEVYRQLRDGKPQDDLKEMMGSKVSFAALVVELIFCEDAASGH